MWKFLVEAQYAAIVRQRCHCCSTQIMKLKSLVIHGFKSFADKTVIEFHSGVTGIVGPNGCGKSNVVDAVRWVLGETSAKALRGGEMSDIIFNGTDKRKPHAMAEVVLTFSDCEQTLGVDYNEVSIGRRVFRDGKGEYEMNGQICRAKDIARLFMDTGVGRNMYSIMEQGKIDMLLSAKPEDRRQVFEEAAGITKSKAEKKEAMRKLEYTEANLLRVTDILSEMKRQIGSAQRQAGKAKRYQELHRDVTVLDTHLHFKKYSEMAVEKAELDTSISSLRLRSADLEHELENKERGLSDARMELAEMESQIGSLRNQLNQTQGQINAANHRIESNTERVREWTGLIEQYDSEVEGGQERMIQQEDDLCRIGDELMQIEVQLEAKKSAMEEQNRAAQNLREERAMHERNLQEARQAMHTAEGIIISAGAEMNSHTAQSVTDQQRQEQLQRELNLMEEERSAKQREEEEIKARLEELAAELEQLHVDTHSREREAQEATSELEITQRQIHEQHRLFSERQSKLKVLQQLIQAGEGLEKGTQAVLGGLGNPAKFSAGTHGLLSTYLEVTDAALIPAIEAAMGGHLQTILVEDTELARQIIESLKSQQLGTAVVLPQNLRHRSQATQMQVLPEGAIAWALDRIRVKDAVRPAIHQLLGNVCLAPDLETALRLKQDLPDVAFATLTGEYLSTEGTIRGGAGKEQAGSILQRQAELTALVAEVEKLELSLQQAEARRDGLVEIQRSAKSAAEEQKEMLQVRRVAESTMQGQYSLVQREATQFASKVSGVEWELSELAKRQDALARKVEEATARRARAEEELEDRRQQSAEMTELLEIRRRDENEATDRLNELKTALAVELRTRQALQEQRAPMQARLRELEEALGKRRREVETFREKIAAAEEETEAMIQGIAEGREQVTELSQVLEARSGERAERAAHLASSEIGLNAIRKETSKLNEQRGSEEVRVTKIGLRMESLMNYAQERYRINLAAFEQDAHALLVSIRHQKSLQGKSEKRRSSFEVNQDDSDEPTAAEQATQRDEDEAFAAGIVSEEGPDWEFVESIVAELKQRLDSMGPVNLDAIQEYEELEERFNFLQKEYDDLNNAKVELLEIIQRINIEAKKRFVETFYLVRDNFRSIFKELFGASATADLVLISEEDPLETGVEIIAKPPGKKPQSITLLSGGERSMTAVALLFSIYMVKPSPFCILDELDAPLDESNVNRFVKMLDKFIAKSQFVIVTHNKNTMRRADVLYGVTMEEFGVSKPVGMKLTAAEKEEGKKQEAKLEAEISAADVAEPEAEALALSEG